MNAQRINELNSRRLTVLALVAVVGLIASACTKSGVESTASVPPAPTSSVVTGQSIEPAPSTDTAERTPTAASLFPSGSTCYANRTGHPGADWIRVDVNDDGGATLTARYDHADGAPTLETGTGFLVSDTAVALDVEQQGQPSYNESQRTEIFTVDDGGISFGLGFVSELTDCAEVNPLLAELDA